MELAAWWADLDLDQVDWSRVWAKIDVSFGGCWLWTGSTTRAGYGQKWQTFDGVEHGMFVHRLMYMRYVGPISDGLTIDHLCRVPRCVNPTHMEPVTMRENNLRGNTMSAINAAKTQCVNGHEFTPENTRWEQRRLGATRVCRACQRERLRRFHERRRAAEVGRLF